MLYLPTQNWASQTSTSDTRQDAVVPRDTLNESAVSAAESQANVAAENAPLRVIYGQARVGAQIACALVNADGKLVVLAVWCAGEVDSVVSYTINDYHYAMGPEYVRATHYTGAAGQGVDPDLLAAFAAQTPPVTYTDSLPGVCYSVLVIQSGITNGYPRLAATVKGRKVWTGAVTEWSDNPAWCLADFCTNTAYGMGKAVDLASAASVAADCDVLAGGEKLRTLNLALETVQPVSNWLDTLRTYAACWVTPTAAGLKFVSDKAASPVAAFEHSAGNIASVSQIKKRGVQSMPTVLTVTYRDTSTTPHRDGTAVVYAPGVLAGTTPRRESSVSLPGITRYSQAWREATERLNKLLLNDLSFTLAVFDDGLALEVGDVVTVTHPIGFAAKPMRIMAVAGDYGRHTLTLAEYDPAVYSTSVTAAPTYADTSLPSPSAPPAVTGVTMTEEVIQLENGTWSSRWRITWAAATYAYLDHYRAELWAGSALIHSTRAAYAEWATPAVQEGIAYTAKVAAVTSIGAIGTWTTQSATAKGKLLLPSNVPAVTAFEAGGRVYGSCTPAVDIDIIKYEWRYWGGGGSWATGKLIDRADSLRMQSDQIPVGTWTLGVKAIDSVFQESPTATTVSVVVTSDASAFLVSAYDQTAPTLTNMAEYSLARTDASRYFVTEDGASVASKFTAALSTYANVMATYHASAASTWLGEGRDWGLLLGGQWTGTATVADISGSHISYFGSSPDGTLGSYTYTAGLSQKLNARFARLKHEALTTSTLSVTIPSQSIRLDAIPRTEVGDFTTSASGAVTVTLANLYVACKKLTLTPFGATARSAVADNIVITPTYVRFDVNGFSDTGARLAFAGKFEWEGV